MRCKPLAIRKIQYSPLLSVINYLVHAVLRAFCSAPGDRAAERKQVEKELNRFTRYRESDPDPMQELRRRLDPIQSTDTARISPMMLADDSGTGKDRGSFAEDPWHPEPSIGEPRQNEIGRARPPRESHGFRASVYRIDRTFSLKMASRCLKGRTR